MRAPCYTESSGEHLTKNRLKDPNIRIRRGYGTLENEVLLKRYKLVPPKAIKTLKKQHFPCD